MWRKLEFTDEDDHLVIEIAGDQVGQLRIDASFSIVMHETLAVIQLEGPFVLNDQTGEHRIDPNKTPEIVPAFNLLNRKVESATASRSGQLRLTFTDSMELRADPDPRWESWHVYSPYESNGPAIHCMAGGELSIYDRQEAGSEPG